MYTIDVNIIEYPDFNPIYVVLLYHETQRNKQLNSKKTTEKLTTRLDLIQTVKTPLGFFTLVVLIVEVIFGVAANFSEGSDRTYLIIGMLLLIFSLIVVVSVFAYLRPEALSGERPNDKMLNTEFQNLTSSQRISKYKELIAAETRENLLLNFNVPENYKSEISTIDKFPFGFCYPESWTFSKLPEQIRYGAAVDKESIKDIGFSRSVNIMIDGISELKLKKDSVNELKSVYENSLKQILALLPEAKLKYTKENIIFHGLSAAKWTIFWVPQDEIKKPLALYQIIVADKDRKNLYTISFTTTQDDFENTKWLFDNIANTFRL